PVELLRLGKLRFRRERASKLHGNALLPGLDRVGLAVLRGGGTEQRYPLLPAVFLERDGGARVVEVAGQAVTVEGIRVALEEIFSEALDLIHVLLFAASHLQVDFGELDDRIDAVRR